MLPIVQFALRLAHFVRNNPVQFLTHRVADEENQAINYRELVWDIVVEPYLDTAKSMWAPVFQVLKIT